MGCVEVCSAQVTQHSVSILVIFLKYQCYCGPRIEKMWQICCQIFVMLMQIEPGGRGTFFWFQRPSLCLSLHLTCATTTSPLVLSVFALQCHWAQWSQGTSPLCINPQVIRDGRNPTAQNVCAAALGGKLPSLQTQIPWLSSSSHLVSLWPRGKSLLSQSLVLPGWSSEMGKCPGRAHCMQRSGVKSISY